MNRKNQQPTLFSEEEVRRLEIENLKSWEKPYQVTLLDGSTFTTTHNIIRSLHRPLLPSKKESART